MTSHQAVAAEKQVNVKVHDPNILWADCSYLAIGATDEGKLFMGFSSHKLDRNAVVLSYDPATQQFAQPFDLGKVTNYKEGELAHSKLHTPFFENDKVLYFGTLVGLPKNSEISQYKPFSSGCFVAYDQRTDKASVVGRAPAEEAIITLEPDFERNCLYGITFPGGLFLRCDITTGEVKNLGVIDTSVSKSKSMPPYHNVTRCMVVHPDTGVVYGSRNDGTIWHYNPDTDKVSDTGLNTKQGIVKGAAGRASQWRMALLSPDKEKIYAIHQGTTSLFELNLKTNTIKPLARLCADADMDSPQSMTASRLSVVLKDGKIYHLASGSARKMDGRPGKLKNQTHYVSYDIATGERIDHGPLMAPGNRRVLKADTLVPLPDGRLFSVALVEVADPVKLKDMKSGVHGKRIVFAEPKGVYYEMLLLELPTMSE